MRSAVEFRRVQTSADESSIVLVDVTTQVGINDSMAKFIAEQTIKRMIASGSAIKGPNKVNVLVKGGAFIDAKAAFDARAMAKAGYSVWRL